MITAVKAPLAQQGSFINPQKSPKNKQNSASSKITYSLYNTKGSSAISFGCLYCALIHVAKESDTGKKLFSQILEQPTESLQTVKPDAFYAELRNSAHRETPPIPFDAGMSTHFIAPRQLYTSDAEGVKALALVNAMIDEAPVPLKEAYIDTLNAPAKNLFDPNARGTWFLASYNVDSSSHHHNHEKHEDHHHHSVGKTERESFTKAQAFPYAVILSKFAQKEDTPEILIGDVRDGIGMKGSNGSVSAIERIIVAACDPKLAYTNRPEKFAIRIPQHVLSRIPEPVVDMLTRQPKSSEELEQQLKKSLVTINNTLSKTQSSSMDKDLKALRSENRAIVKALAPKDQPYPDGITSMYLKSRSELSQQRGLGFKKVESSDGENLLLEINLSDSNKIADLLANIRMDTTGSRVMHHKNEVDPAFNEHSN